MNNGTDNSRTKHLKKKKDKEFNSATKSSIYSGSCLITVWRAIYYN